MLLRCRHQLNPGGTIGFWSASLLLCMVGCHAAEWAGQASAGDGVATRVELKPGEFLGIVGVTQIRVPLSQQLDWLKSSLESNPHLKGMTIRVAWDELEPQDGKFFWDGMDRAIQILRSRGLHITLELLGGCRSPGWIYERGVPVYKDGSPRFRVGKFEAF